MIFASRWARSSHASRPAAADVIVPIPDSGVPAAIGYAQESGLPFELGIIRNHYVGRTFIEPEQRIRQLGVKLKHSANAGVIRGKRIVLIDDSVVRGTTSKKIVQLMYDAGAREVHLRISSPPITHPDYYGIDTPRKTDLIAANLDLESMRQFMGADSLNFLSVERHLPGRRLRSPRCQKPAVHRPLLHGRISDRAYRPERLGRLAPALAPCRGWLRFNRATHSGAPWRDARGEWLLAYRSHASTSASAGRADLTLGLRQIRC